MQRVRAALPYVRAAIVTPVLFYLLQPRFCLEHLFFPYVLRTIAAHVERWRSQSNGATA